MKKNIQFLRQINDEDAPLFLTEALRFYARQLMENHPAIVLVEPLRSRLRMMAEPYLQWEDAEVQKIMDEIALQNKAAYETQYKKDTVDEINWEALEEQALKALGE